MRKVFVLQDIYSFFNAYALLSELKLPFPVYYALIKNKVAIDKERSVAEEARLSYIDPEFKVFVTRLESLNKQHALYNPDGSVCVRRDSSGVSSPMYKNPEEFRQLVSEIESEFSEAIARQKEFDTRFRAFLQTTVEIDITPIDAALLSDCTVSEPVARLLTAFIE